jgi:D-alanyl-D-alanine carboxypeptidase
MTVGAILGSMLEALRTQAAHPMRPIVRIERADGTLLWEGASGQARADEVGDLTPQHRFHVASIAKTMTAALVLRRLESGAFGRAGLDARLVDLDVLPGREVERLSRYGSANCGSSITLRHLLTHTAGLRDAMVDDTAQLGGPAPGSLIGRLMGAGGDPMRAWVPWDPSRPDDSDAGVINFFLNSGIAGTALGLPGQAFHYSDTGYVLLGLALERVAGRPLHEQLREEIFAPLGLHDSYLAYRDDPPGLGSARRPEADCWAEGTPCLSAGISLSFDWAGGGVVSTARDLIAFLRALLGGRLFDHRETLQAMIDWLAPSGLEPPRSGVGLGLFRVQSSCGPLIGHSGAWGAKMFYAPDLDLYIAGTTNQSASPHDWHWPFLEAARRADITQLQTGSER